MNEGPRWVPIALHVRAEGVLAVTLGVWPVLVVNVLPWHAHPSQAPANDPHIGKM